ncbi:MAG TPA: NAD/NADP octopine/nopaline dehydrogenase family protein [Stellaceae bacterium]|nr:NAD/NADP octopine/nopaline dehydrogenase family protein [Stellaceae bacterium]
MAVLGAGSIGFGTAAFLGERGHEPVLWSPSGGRTVALATGAALKATGAVVGEYHPRIAQSCADAVAEADAVLVAVPGNGHRRVIDALVPVLGEGQPVLINSHCSLSALYLSKRLAERGIAAPIVAWGTTVLTGRALSGTEVAVNAVRKQIDIATLPVAAGEAGLALCRSLFGDRFVLRADVLAISLSNLNPQNHMGMALCNLTRMERGEAWGNYAGITPAVGRLIEALDAERLAVAKAFGLAVRTVHEHFHLSFHVPLGSLGEMAQRIHDRDGGPPGPTTLDSRFVTEDVPYGLVPSELIARLAGVPSPLHTSGIELFSALYGRDFRAENDLLPELGLADLSATGLHALAREGWPKV